MKKQKDNTPVITYLTLLPDMKDRLKAYGRDRYLPITQIIRQALDEWLAERGY